MILRENRNFELFEQGSKHALAQNWLLRHSVTRKSPQSRDCDVFGDVDLRKKQVLKKAEVCTVVLASRSGRYDHDILKRIAPLTVSEWPLPNRSALTQFSQLKACKHAANRQVYEKDQGAF